jgi:hypothetical protein
VRALWQRFFNWYERNYTINVVAAAGLFLLQLVHLYWLTMAVVYERLFGESLFDPNGVLYALILIVDYTEIPALIGVSLIYINELRKDGFGWKPVLFLLFLNSQWLHIFWITDEFVVNEFTGEAAASSLPAWLAWAAILIDYLELPVIYDTMKKAIIAIRERRVSDFLKEDLAH